MTVPPPEGTQANAPAVSRAPRWIWIVLVVSVALNLLVIGMAAATIAHFHYGHRGPAGKLARFIEELPAERQSKLRAVFDERRPRLRPLRRALRDARRRARDAFAAEPFDREALAKAYADAAKARMALTEAREDWFGNLAQLLTAEERKKFLRMRRHHRSYKWRRHRRADDRL